MNKDGLTLKVNQNIDTSQLVKEITELGYENIGISTLAKEGQFSRRGGVVDIWLERYKLPVRFDLIGEKIENIYLFNIITQDKIKRLKEVYILTRGLIPKLGPKWTKNFTVEKGSYERLFLSEIEEGDLVVHIDHGVGRFLGIKSDPTGTGKQALIVEYAKGDKLFVPIEQIERLTKYIGVAGYKPNLSRLGTLGWERTKRKVQENVFAYATELLDLYAKRELEKRSRYHPDTPWQRQLEESFEFSETADQEKALAEIKRDLESPKPMERLLVGDVGFGKTELAIRSAFKVVQEGKQVAVLVPTTILAQQHYHLFKERLKNFPVKVEKLSRFAKNEGEILKKLAEGSIDTIIGTHRLLSSDVHFHNLGLLIIDEEHRFGVRSKEKLKQLRPEVDVLSMSATPIPRSLQMALAKIRDMSVLSEAPGGRKPIQTFISDFDEEKIKESIHNELSRGGQVYYVFNHVDKIAQKSREVSLLVPEAKVVFAHGQMDKRKGGNLEKVMADFYNKKYNVLVCTTIIGSGLDMPNVNTIIIEDAHRFGLADLYQLRGRVGRSEREAYAYVFYPKNWLPEGDSLERLLALAESTHLGAGFQIARKDLEIRGAGNLLGTAQHGSIALVGFELYMQLLANAAEALKSDKA